MNFKIGMTDGMSGPAKASAAALSQLDAQIKNESKALQSLETQYDSLGKASDESASASQKAEKAIKSTGTAAKESEKSFKELAVALGAEVAAILAIPAAVGLASAALLKMGSDASEAKGDTVRSLELLYGSQEAAEHTYKVIEGITSRVAMSQGRAIELTDAFTKAGQANGDQLVKSIEAVGKAEAARKGAGQVIEGIISRSTSSRMFSVSRSELMQVGLSYRDLSKEIAKQTGKGLDETEIMLRTGGVRMQAGIDALSAAIESKMGKLADEKFMTVGNQTQRLHDNFTRLFEGMNTGPLAQALKVFADLLDESSVSGSALRDLLGKVFDDLSGSIKTLAPYMQEFFDGMVLLAYDAYNALYPLRKTIHNLFGGDQKKGLDSFEDSMINFANNVAKGFATAAVALAWIIDKATTVDKFLDKLDSKTGGASGTAITAMVNPMGLLFKDWGAGAKDAPANDNAKDSGKSVADGVAEGIKSGTPAVDSAMAALGDSAVKAFDAKMQIHSPSKVMAKRGEYLNEGTAQGIERSSDTVGSAMAGVGSGLPGAMGGGSGGGGVQVHFEANAIVIHGSMSDAQQSQLRAQLADMMADVFQQAALLNGAGAAA